MASSRLQRWCRCLSAYDYVLEFRAGILNRNTDGLSRLPLGDFPGNVPIPEDVVCVLNHINNTTATVVDFRKLTCQYPTLSFVLQCVKTIWPTLLSNNVEPKPYYIRRSELNVLDDCILWGSKVIVPPKRRKNILHELHEAHPGIVRMKSLARSYLWWRLIDIVIESVVKVKLPHH